MVDPIRTPQLLVEAVLAIDPQNSFCLQPRDGYSCCNEAARFILAVLGVHLPRDIANNQFDWLNSIEANAHGWMPVDAETARQRAELGYPTVTAWKNPGGHGHIAICIPAPDVDTGHLYVAAAGASNTNSQRIERQFPGLHPSFWTIQ